MSASLRAVDRLVFPLDVPSLDEARPLVRLLGSSVGVLKVGLELFVGEGSAAVELVHEAGAACFLDLKLHDIPATMAGAARSAARLGVRYLTVHASAGSAALLAVRDALEGTGTTPLAVTVLTSLAPGDLAALGVPDRPEAVVARLVELAVGAGLAGFVCSPREAARVRAIAGADALIVTPGVRPRGAAARDQRRTATPADAIRAGADLLVVGRPIRHAPDPPAAARAIVEEIEGALS